MIVLEGNMDLSGVIISISILIIAGPSILLSIIGLAVKRSYPKTAKVFFILAASYLLIGLSICGSLLIG